MKTTIHEGAHHLMNVRRDTQVTIELDSAVSALMGQVGGEENVAYFPIFWANGDGLEVSFKRVRASQASAPEGGAGVRPTGYRAALEANELVSRALVIEGVDAFYDAWKAVARRMHELGARPGARAIERARLRAQKHLGHGSMDSSSNECDFCGTVMPVGRVKRVDGPMHICLSCARVAVFLLEQAG